MIMIQLKLSKVKNPFTDYHKAVEEMMEKGPSCCNCRGKMKKNGTYQRSVSWGRQKIYFRVQRVLCTWCGKSHTLLPCFLLPFTGITLIIREAALIMYGAGLPIEQIAEKHNIAPRTISIWCRHFRLRMKAIIYWVAKKLAHHSAEIDWLKGAVLGDRAKVGWVFELLERLRAAFYPGHTTGVLPLLNFLAPELLK